MSNIETVQAGRVQTEDGPLLVIGNLQCVYKRRWYILVLFSAVTFAQGVVWNTWGPLADSGRQVFGWTAADIALLANWGCAMYLLLCVPFSYLMDVKGLRVAVVITTIIVFLGTVVRCCAMVFGVKTWAIHIGQALNAAGGPVCFGAPPLLSDLWFPVHERSTATAISVMSSYLGVASSYVLGIIFVRTPGYPNGTNANNVSREETSTDNLLLQKTEIERLLVTHCALCGVLVILVAAYFPDKPPSAPSASASLTRVGYRQLIPKLLRNGQLWCIVLSGALSAGIYGAWLSLLDSNLSPFGFTQREAGLLGVYASVAACVSAVAICRFSDKFSKGLRTILIILSIIGTLCYLAFSLLCQRILPFSKVGVYLTCILGGMVVNAAIPLFYEFACECGYPLPEGATATFLTMWNTIIGFVFYMVLQIPGAGTGWMNWALVGAVGVGIFLLYPTKNTYIRSTVDK